MAAGTFVGQACGLVRSFLWRTLWNGAGGFGDWSVQPAAAPPGAAPAAWDASFNRGGLWAGDDVATAVILCLFTDRRCPPDHPLARNVQDGDPRGWWGDGVDVRTDLGERELGSLLWLLENTAVDPVDTPRWLQSLALDALSVLTACGAVARIDAQAGVGATPNSAWLAVQLYGRDGAKVFEQRFASLWAQEGRG